MHVGVGVRTASGLGDASLTRHGSQEGGCVFGGACADDLQGLCASWAWCLRQGMRAVKVIAHLSSDPVFLLAMLLGLFVGEWICACGHHRRDNSM